VNLVNYREACVFNRKPVCCSQHIFMMKILICNVIIWKKHCV